MNVKGRMHTFTAASRVDNDDSNPIQVSYVHVITLPTDSLSKIEQ